MAISIEGPCQSYKHQYYRSQYNCLYLPYVEKLSFRLSHLALKHQKYYDFLMHNVLPGGMESDIMKACRVKIVTMGKIKKCVGFGNEEHVDKCDKIVKEECKKIKTFIAEGKNHVRADVVSMALYLDK